MWYNKKPPLHQQERFMRPLQIPEIGRLNHNISGDATAFRQKYCIIFGQPLQAELLFFVGCYFYTHF